MKGRYGQWVYYLHVVNGYSKSFSTNLREESCVFRHMFSQPPVKRTVVKALLTSIGWKPQYLQKLHELVSVVNTLTTHTYQFARFIFIRELKEDFNFPLEKWIKKDFFVEVFISLIKQRRESRELVAGSQELRQLATTRLTSYLQASSFDRIPLKYAQQIALY